MTGTRAVLVVGAGPGVSGSLARARAREGYAVGLLGIDAGVLETLAAELRGLGAAATATEVADLTDGPAAAAAVRSLAGSLGGVDHLHFNPSAYREADPLALTPDQLAEDVALGVGALLTVVQAAREHLRPGASVTATGSAAADRPSAAAASLGVQKAALRNLVLSLDTALAEHDVRAASVTVDGVLAPKDPASTFHPDRVAAALVDAADQDHEFWEAHLHHPPR